MKKLNILWRLITVIAVVSGLGLTFAVPAAADEVTTTTTTTSSNITGITITAPVASATIGGDAYSITWTVTGTAASGDTFNVDYWDPGTSNYINIVNDLAYDQTSTIWDTTKVTAGTSYKIRVESFWSETLNRTAENTGITIDNTPPTVTINQAEGQADPTNVSPINFTVVFSEPVTGFTGDSVALSGTAIPDTAVVTGEGPTYNVAVSGMTQSGTVIAAINAGAVHDVAGNANTASTSTDHTVTWDVTGPNVTINAVTSPTNVNTQTITGTMDEEATVALTGDPTFGTVTYPTSTTWSCVATLVEGANSITATASDALGNPGTADASVTLDTVAPTVTDIDANTQFTNQTPVNFRVVFSEPVVNFGNSGVTISGTAGATTAAVTPVVAEGTVSGASVFDVAVSGMAQDGTVIITIAAGVCQDLAGNANLASSITHGNSSTYDTTPPVITFTGPSALSPSVTPGATPPDVYRYITGSATDNGSGINQWGAVYGNVNPTEVANETHHGECTGLTSIQWLYDIYSCYGNGEGHYKDGQTFTLTIVVEDEAGNVAHLTSNPFVFKWLQAQDFIKLYEGWNFISFPAGMAPDFATFGDILNNQGIPATAVYDYNAANANNPWGTGIGVSDPVNVLDGYWINVDIYRAPQGYDFVDEQGHHVDHVYIGFSYADPGNGSATGLGMASKVVTGNAWNAIGITSPYGINWWMGQNESATDSQLDQQYGGNSQCPLAVDNQLSSIKDSWSTIMYWDASNQQYATTIFAPGDHKYVRPGYGYWIFISKDTNDTYAAICNGVTDFGGPP